ncbi:MAG: DUF6473 family protein [Steroidobacteraceae bacterium]
MKLWYPNYQPRDYELVDYERFYVDGCEIPFRGPPLNPFRAAPGSYFSCLGAVQTYGAFYAKPFPTLLAESLGMPSLNLAVGGAGPGFYTQYPKLLEAMNRGRFVILQCMAARHAGNSRFEPDGYVEFVIDRKVGDSIPSWAGWKRVVVEELDNALRYVDETRKAWVDISLDLISRITVPVIFFYYSRRKPEYQIDMEAVKKQAEVIRSGADNGAFVEGLMGDFPHLVDGASVRQVAAACAGYAECLSARGMGQALVSRFTGKPLKEQLEHSALGAEFVNLPQMSHNWYYPSPEMHEDARDALLPEIRRVLETHPAH